MDIADWERERFIRRVLKILARQRIAAIGQPGNIWIVEKSFPDLENLDEALGTCHMRGWVEPIANAVPKGVLAKDLKLPEKIEAGTIYRLTEAGWNAIHRLHGWVVATFIVSLAALVISVFALINPR